MAVSEKSLPEIQLPMSGPPHSRRRAVLLEFLKFCMVGALSTAINVKLFSMMMAYGVELNLAHFLSFSLAVTNGFFLNRAWTFRHSRAHKMEHQYAMFFAVNVVGAGLAWMVMRLVGAWLLLHGPTHAWLLHSSTASTLAGLLNARSAAGIDASSLAHSLGELSATPLCAVWNFSANKLWTFRGARH